MIVDSTFLDNENNRRLGLGIGAAILAHALVLAWFALPFHQEKISADILSAPTNISIRFISTIKEQPVTVPKKTPPPVKIVKAETPKIVPQKLNKIEPAAALQTPPQPIEKVTEPTPLQPVQKSIPVVSEAKLKGRRIQPEYPKRSLRLGQEGVVLLHVLINETGARQDIKIHKASQYALLNQAAMKAVKKWTFDPNIVNGQAIASWVEIPIEFKIQ